MIYTLDWHFDKNTSAKNRNVNVNIRCTEIKVRSVNKRGFSNITGNITIKREMH